MKHHWNVAVAGLAVLLSACGGGGGGGEAPAPAAQLKDYFQSFTSYDYDSQLEHVTLVNVADFNQKIDLGDVYSLTAFYAGARNGSLIQDIRPHSLYFVQGSRLKRVSLRHGQSQAPVQVSNEFLTRSCMWPRVVEPNLGSDAGAILLYSVAGPDGGCFTADDAYRSVGINAAATTTPAAGVIAAAIFEFRDSNGALLSLLAQAWDGTLRLYSADLASSITLPLSGWTSPLTAVGSSALFEIGGEVRRIDWTGAVSEPVHTVAEQIRYWESVADGTHFYFTDGGYAVPAALYRVRLDGTAPAELLSDGGVELLGLTDSKAVVFHDSQVLALDKDPAAAGTPELLQTADRAFATHGYAPLLYTTLDFINNEALAHRLDPDGAHAARALNSAWVGVQYARDWTASQWLGTAAAPVIGAFEAAYIPDIFHFGFPGSVIQHVDPAGSATPVAAVANDEFWNVIGVGTVGMGLIYTERPEPQYAQADVFSFDLETPRLERHTVETDTDEYPYAF